MNTYWSYIVWIGINTFWSCIVIVYSNYNWMASNIVLWASNKYFLTSQGLVGADMNCRALISPGQEGKCCFLGTFTIDRILQFKQPQRQYILENYCWRTTSQVGSWTWKSTSPADLGSITFKCNRLHYNYFAIFMITLRLHQFSNVID